MRFWSPVLVGDVGGTHARFAVATAGSHGPALSHRRDIEGEYADVTGLLCAYMKDSGLEGIPTHALIAVAGPVTAGVVTLTNRHLRISETDLEAFGFARTALINDFGALAYAADILGAEDLSDIGPALEGVPDAPISIVGAGTGFGVSCLVRHGGRALPMTTEGGHIGFAPTDDQQMALLSSLQCRFGRVSVERLLSGPGIESIHRAMEAFKGAAETGMSAEQITAGALAGEATCKATLSLFCKVYGAIAGDIALAHGARGGVLIGGGIALKIEPFLQASPFRQEFDNKGRLAPYVKAIPTRLIVNADATLLGAARAALELWYRD
ncbi:MAG TPA: glucokinase [Steroidobacteraceae bacterium]|nr:glucokinase [Steroidobacteraceae bacterium]